MKTLTAIIEIQTQSPLHITALESGRYVPETGRIVRSEVSGQASLACSLTRTLSIKKATPSETPDGRTIDFSRVPVIPANTLGGRLRTACCELVEESLVLRGLKLTPRTFNTLRKGSATTSLARSEQTVVMARYGANHPLIGIFGGTTFGIDANLVVHEGLPVTEDTLPLLVASPMAADMVRDFMLTEALPIVRKDALIDLERPDHIAALVGVDAVNEYHEAEMGRSAAKKAKKDAGETGKKESLRAIATVEAVRPGLHFQLAFRLRARNDEQIGIFLLGLKRVIDSAQIGGKAARGFGRFSVIASRLTVREPDGSSVESPLFGLRAEGEGYAWNLSDELSGAVAAAETWIESLDPRELEMLASEDAPAQIKALVA